MGISGFGDLIQLIRAVISLKGFNSLWELAGLVTHASAIFRSTSRWFQFPMGISGFGDEKESGDGSRCGLSFQFPMGISGFGDPVVATCEACGGEI